MTKGVDRRTWAVAALVWLLVELLRGWTPLLITVFGRAAETPPELIGLFALAVTAVPLAALAGAGDRLHHPVVPPVLVIAALVARLLLPFLSGYLLLTVATIGVAAALLALALAAGHLGDALVPGLFVGLAVAATTHAALGTWGAAHRLDAAGAVSTALLVALIATTLRAHREGPAAPAAIRTAALVLPVLLLAGIALANPARGLVATAMGAMVVVAAAVVAALLAQRGWGRWHRVAGAVALVVGTAATMIPDPLGLPSLLGMAVGLPGLAVLLSPVPAAAPAQPSPTRVSRVVASTALLFTVLLFAFYAGYDMGYRADWVVVAVAVVVAVVALLPLDAPGVTTAQAPLPSRSLSVVLVAALAAGIGPLLSVRALDDGPAPADGVVRVAAWNLRMGYGMDGTFRPDEVARVLRDEGSDIVLLSEIDRAWLLNGGQDQLTVLARLLGFHLAFGPAGDQVWGDAILSRWPLTDIRDQDLPGYDSLTGATALSATVTPPKGPALRVVATHLQPDADGSDPTLRQARDVAALASPAKGDPLPVVLGGDFNFEPGSGSWTALREAGFRDALADARPLRTARSDALTEEIDHIFVSEGVRASKAQAPKSLLSDHLPVVVELRLPAQG